MRDDVGLEKLLDLNGSIIDQGNGYWINIEAWRVGTDVDSVLKEVKRS